VDHIRQCTGFRSIVVADFEPPEYQTKRARLIVECELALDL
jgi:hypothetical protein